MALIPLVFLAILVPTFLMNLPLIVMAFLVRRRLQTRLISLLLACGFVVSGSFQMWRMEWYDVWRLELPSTAYLLTSYVPYLAAMGVTGWLIGRLIVQMPIGPSPKIRPNDLR